MSSTFWFLLLFSINSPQFANRANHGNLWEINNHPHKHQINPYQASNLNTYQAKNETKNANTWLVRVERDFGGESAIGEILVKQETAPNPENFPHIKLAGSRAWLALGKSKLANKDTQAAISCAQAGIDELGTKYTSPLTNDDTGMKLFVAEDRIEEGFSEDGARIMLNMLEIRTQLYAELHKITIIK
jgi:hypothetical protein